MRRRHLLIVGAAGTFVLAACTSGGSGPTAPTSTTVITQVSTTVTTIVATPSPTPTSLVPTYVPAPARTVAPLPPGAKPPAGQVEKRCPYIASSPDQDAKTNVADINGSHVYRTTVLTTLKPVGCRFYFYSGPFQAEVEIAPQTFATALQAHNAAVLTATAGTQAHAVSPAIGAGVDAVLYRTKFFGPDGAQDWACVFAKGTVMVVVRTDRTDTELNALLLAEAVVGRF